MTLVGTTRTNIRRIIFSLNESPKVGVFTNYLDPESQYYSFSNFSTPVTTQSDMVQGGIDFDINKLKTTNMTISNGFMECGNFLILELSDNSRYVSMTQGNGLIPAVYKFLPADRGVILLVFGTGDSKIIFRFSVAEFKSNDVNIESLVGVNT